MVCFCIVNGIVFFQISILQYIVNYIHGENTKLRTKAVTNN
jgi:hypothetical protein